MRQAIRLVREHQGPEAVILSSRRVESGIEIVSAMDYDEDLVTEMADRDGAPEIRFPEQAINGPNPDSTATNTSANRHDEDRQSLPDGGDGPEGPGPGEPPKEIVWSQDPTLVAMRREIEGLRGMLQDQLASLAWNDLRVREPGRVRVIRRLEGLGLDAELAREIAAGVRNHQDPDRAWREALADLSSRISCMPAGSLGSDGVVVLVGPSGVGKTTTLAKLAARHVQSYGRHSAALVTTDAYRIGAHRQLQTYGQVLGLPVHLAQTGRELGEILLQLRERQRVFVDTAGMSQRDLGLAGELAALESIPDQRTLLVVGANTQQSVLEETMRVFGKLPIAGAVLSKIDEATTLGPALSAFCRAGMPLVFLSEGQRVPEDLQAARAERLVEQAVALGSDPQEGEPDGVASPGFPPTRKQYAHVSA